MGLGLLYMHSRHVDPRLGRFIGPDRSGQGEKSFVYVGNDPVSVSDPLGSKPGPWRRIFRRVVHTPEHTALNFVISATAGQICGQYSRTGYKSVDFIVGISCAALGLFVAATLLGTPGTDIHEVWIANGLVSDIHYEYDLNGRERLAVNYRYNSGGGYAGARLCGEVFAGLRSAYSMDFLCGYPISRSVGK